MATLLFSPIGNLRNSPIGPTAKGHQWQWKNGSFRHSFAGEVSLYEERDSRSFILVESWLMMGWQTGRSLEAVQPVKDLTLNNEKTTKPRVQETVPWEGDGEREGEREIVTSNNCNNCTSGSWSTKFQMSSAVQHLWQLQPTWPRRTGSGPYQRTGLANLQRFRRWRHLHWGWRNQRKPYSWRCLFLLTL